ncbi:MAG: 4Fe-4S binding protein [Spirochaetales bacterium]|nr:4Fe-4S binding protein [Spirochaetales bacterium]
MNDKGLRKIVEVDKDKCVNCHACIGACPVKFCNDGSGDHVTINEQLCIGCGSCITACTHEARYGLDDFSIFLDACNNGDRIIAITAPAAASNFPGEYLKLNGWLKTLGVSAFFDVSFGAELTIKSYLEHVKKNKPKTVISQPCPAIVTYIETYKPELLPFLAPADSPMLHTIKMIKEYYKKYSSYKVAVISPCYAKKREFDETGFGDFNITYKSISSYLTDNNLDLSIYNDVDFMNSAAERAVLFSTPGGLMRTLEREAPKVSRGTRKIEGPDIIYNYLDHLTDSIEGGKVPAVIDCLNCELGCNGGPGTMNIGKSPDDIEYAVEQRNLQMQARYKGIRTKAGAAARVRRTVNKYWKKNLYDRSYIDRSSQNNIIYPDDAELTVVYKELHKYIEKDHLNCGACGYGSCRGMAIAIFNNLNKVENCFHYERLNRKEMSSLLTRRLKESITNIMNFVMVLSGDEKNGEESKSGIAKIFDLSKENKDIVNNGVSYIEDTILKMTEIQETSNDTIGGIQNLGDQIEGIWEIVGIINGIAAQTKIIAFNAELEASSAGEKGKNFEIVASEIRRLADNTVLSTQEIRKRIKEIQQSSSNLVYAGQEESEKIKEGWELSSLMQEVFQKLLLQSETSYEHINGMIGSQINNFESTLHDLQQLTADIDHFNS